MIEIRHTGEGGLRAAYDEFYESRQTRHEDDYYRWLIRLLRPQAGRSLLDVACGEGPLVRTAAAAGLCARGVDLSRTALAKAGKNRGEESFVQAEGERLPFANGTFDYVTSIGSLEHYENPDRGAAELKRVLAPGGRALILLPNTFGLYWTIKHAWRTGEIFDDGQPIQRYGTRKEWERLLAGQGLATDEVLGFDVPARPQSLKSWIHCLLRPWGWPRLIFVWMMIPINLAGCLVYLCTHAENQE